MTSWPEILNADQFFLRERLEEGRGERVALRLAERVVTYAEVDSIASGYSSLLSETGVGPGDRVLMVLPDGLDYPAAVFGVLRLGAVVVMVNPALTPGDMRSIIDRARAAAVVIHPDHLEAFAGAVGETGPETVLAGSAEPDSGPMPTFPTRPQDPAMWLFSGGTTGAPKAVAQTHKSLVNTARLYGQGTLGLNAEDVTISVPKLFFGYAMGSNLLFPFSVGASTVLFEGPATPEVVFDMIRRHRPTVLVNVPSAINQMLNHSGPQDLSSLRLATAAGEALPETLYHRWVETFGVELLDGLGTAEMWHIFISNRLGEVRPGTLGRVVDGFEIKACDEAGVEVPRGEIGRLWVRGDSLGLGYWEDPERTAEAFRPPWFVGGDLVSIDEQGFVTHRGRSDDAIKVKGRWFRPQELESVLLDHPSVRESAVVAVEDESGLARPVAFVVRSGSVTEDDLRKWSLEKLEAYKHPRRVIFVDSLPQTHLGKVDRTALRGMA